MSRDIPNPILTPEIIASTETVVFSKTLIKKISTSAQYLQYTRVAILGEIVEQTELENFYIFGKEFFGQETELANYSISFKQLETNKYQLTINYSLYAMLETKKTQAIELTFIVSYINERGHNEIRKYKA